ncbi:MAG: hypothetical protein JST13_04325 [Bacteroidetes bacterium]|nr:hypothetical protein [Bacteroidota bacterium]
MIKQIFRHTIKPVLVTSLLIVKSHCGQAQPKINGPACIIPGTTYQYIISGQWDASANARVCITGGALTGGDSCISLKASPAMLLLAWKYNVAERNIRVSSALGNVSLEINATTDLTGGVLDDSDEVQVLNADQAIYTFHCGIPAGGSCNPHYTYQWQSSSNQLNWVNIPGANGKDLRYSGTITVSTYFRRVTTEAKSNMLAYSDSGQLMIAYQ